MCRLLACLALAVLAGPAAACINDLELPSHEREFRSNYLSPAQTPPPPAPYPEPTDHRLLVTTGAALLAGATALTLVGARRRN